MIICSANKVILSIIIFLVDNYLSQLYLDSNKIVSCIYSIDTDFVAKDFKHCNIHTLLGAEYCIFVNKYK